MLYYLKTNQIINEILFNQQINFVELFNFKSNEQHR